STLILAELLPETLEYLESDFKYLLLFIYALAGFLILKIFDSMIPDHCHGGHDHEPKSHLNHISIVSSIALILHNVIEGMAVYTSAISSPKLGLMVGLGVGIHNIPLGIVIASTYQKANNNQKKTIIISLIISLSTFVGGIIMCLLNTSINNNVLGALLGITLGMLVHILVFELLPQVVKNKDKKITVLGVITGVLILLVALLLD
ncbi:MAG: ZIP family metal transporter, partial [Bacilli bacterium]